MWPVGRGSSRWGCVGSSCRGDHLPPPPGSLLAPCLLSPWDLGGDPDTGPGPHAHP